MRAIRLPNPALTSPSTTGWMVKMERTRQYFETAVGSWGARSIRVGSCASCSMRAHRACSKPCSTGSFAAFAHSAGLGERRFADPAIPPPSIGTGSAEKTIVTWPRSWSPPALFQYFCHGSSPRGRISHTRLQDPAPRLLARSSREDQFHSVQPMSLGTPPACFLDPWARSLLRRVSF
jgi:hypothetical protein